MKNIFIILLVFTMFLSCTKKEEKALQIYIYESLDWIEDVIPMFEQEHNCEVNVVKLSDSGTLLSRLKLEAKDPDADVVIGLDQTGTGLAVKSGLLEKYKSINLPAIKDDGLIFNKDFYITPFDYGAIAIVYNPESLGQTPATFEDITKLEKSLIIQDPRNSSTGKAFLLWTIAVFGDKWTDYWKRLKNAVLTTTPGWSEAFGKFEAGEAPMMVSYATDGAYSYHYYQSTAYKAFIPREGAFVQIEGAGIIANAKHPVLAKKFIDFILTDDFQAEIPLHQWMFPVTNVGLPKAFDYALVPEKVIALDSEIVQENLETWLEQWLEIMQ